MDIEGVASFEVLAVEKALTFLKQEIVGSWAQDDFVGLIGDWLLDDLRLQDAASDSRQINAEQCLLICENPMFGEDGCNCAGAEFEPSQAEYIG